MTGSTGPSSRASSSAWSSPTWYTMKIATPSTVLPTRNSRAYSDSSLMSHITCMMMFSIRGSSGPSNLSCNWVAIFCLSNLNPLMNTFPCSCETQIVHEYKNSPSFDVQRTCCYQKGAETSEFSNINSAYRNVSKPNPTTSLTQGPVVINFIFLGIHEFDENNGKRDLFDGRGYLNELYHHELDDGASVWWVRAFYSYMYNLKNVRSPEVLTDGTKEDRTFSFSLTTTILPLCTRVRTFVDNIDGLSSFTQVI